MSLAFGAHVSVSGGVDTAFARGERFAMDAIQVFTKNQRQWVAKPLGEEEVTRWYGERGRTGITKVITHASYLINLASPKDELRQKSMTAFQDELERCETLGISGLVIHPGSHTGSGEEAGLAAVADSLNRIHEAAPHLRVQTLLETTAGQGTNLGRTFEELATIIDQVEAKERIGICLDTCHVFAAGYDIRTDETYAEMMRAFDETLGIPNLKAIHLNDSKFPLGSKRDRHEHIGEGEIGLEGFRNVVNDSRLAGLPGLLETEKGDDDEFDGKNLATLRGLVTTTV